MQHTMGVSGATQYVIQAINPLDIEWNMCGILDKRQIAARVGNLGEIDDFAAVYRHDRHG